MALARKPKAKDAPDVEELIERGGSVPSETKKAGSTTTVPLRLPRDLLARVDRAVANQPIKSPRNTWVLQAILDRLERDGVY